MSRRNATLKAIIDVILYENPSTQDEIAKKLGITRRYVTKLLRPLIRKGVVKRAYMVDLQRFEEFADVFGEEVTSREYAGSFFIKELLRDMAGHVCKQLEKSFQALADYDKELADEALRMDYVTNHMHEKIRSSVDTAIAMNPYSEFGRAVVFTEIAYDLERIGDHSGIIANFTVKEAYPVDPEIMDYLRRMYETAVRMVKKAMKAFLNEKLELRDDVMKLEKEMHRIQRKALNCIATQMAETSFDKKERSTYYISLSRIVKTFERIGDISVEIVDTAVEFYMNIPRTTTPERFRRL
ncbi:phosphate uptake regulator PhoU [Methanothermobacter tenebrarum]|uniref:PhoU family transcriptional regulator n=1 Tax=Methanothermobacter tenebrarum TaxID=680118 RepID=A0A328PCZ2_9EURY|nr:phosphate uptake regulator PhoU [Methanothermobacter tenebrarum]MBC7100793.1 winged helix-turn-helix transcriptional regulator [Methanobacteriales archaeon]MBC7118751.1 winged helix-turn-helix transcriptional regulator [Methanobacteriaceae archaeon]NPV63934.1 winged helix-turn-helix transcriptional regulator [Methanobacteriaceae archaeon]RAO79113.1 PhoU family transcriptional regulator [Methanothermobacter tenebrarum]